MKITAPVRIDISGGWPDSDPYRLDYGGAVLNAAINLRVYSQFKGYLKINPCKIPTHSGLGTSGALRSVELVASNNSLINDKDTLIKKVWHLENEIIGHRAGFQDQAAAIYGGVNLWKFLSSKFMHYKLESIEKTEIERRMADHLENRLVLLYTGENHLSADIHSLVFGYYYHTNIGKLDRMKEIAFEMKNNLDNEKIMSDLINETWDLQKSLHSSIETDFMRKVQRESKGKYLAVRATGAGGGGSMIFYTDDKETLSDFLKKLGKGKVIPFKFEYEGIKIEK